MSIEEYKQQFLDLAKKLREEHGNFKGINIDPVLYDAGQKDLCVLRLEVNITF